MAAPSLKSKWTVLEGELPRKLDHSHVGCSRRERSIGRSGWCLCEDGCAKGSSSKNGLSKRRAVVRMIQPVIGIHSQLEVHAFVDPESLANAHVTCQEPRATEGVSADYIAGEICAGCKLVWCGWAYRLGSVTSKDAETGARHAPTYVWKVPLLERGL